MRLLGIDYGEKRVGLALSDEAGQFAFPYSIIKNESGVVQQIQNICMGETVSEIIIGESRTYRGKENPVMKKIIMFKKKLELATRLPVYLHPETLTSQEAKRGREEKNKKPVDDSAAALILQSFIDTRQEGKRGA